VIALRYPQALRVVILWRSQPLARQDYRPSQLHRFSLPEKVLMQWAYGVGTICITITITITIMAITIAAVATTIASDAERLF
jgi:hypothetical protein